MGKQGVSKNWPIFFHRHCSSGNLNGLHRILWRHWSGPHFPLFIWKCSISWTMHAKHTEHKIKEWLLAVRSMLKRLLSWNWKKTPASNGCWTWRVYRYSIFFKDSLIWTAGRSLQLQANSVAYVKFHTKVQLEIWPCNVVDLDHVLMYFL